ncbi:T9SS type A sorting domain-containing protein [Tenacibaculum sp. ZS6-P6]|uniref:T9SS type A sorting domain-containing protein n=1 Tax=Tenacibaculum sp. ZS6-P6 TaxID=3447503 RepID=UPI003F9BC62B
MIKFLLTLLIFTCTCSYSQSTSIRIDGNFDDWTSELTTFTDTNESLDGIDLLEFQVTNDAEYLYIKVKANKEFDLTDGNIIPHNFFMYLDTDNNSSTGFRVRDDYGAELGIQFGERVLFNNFVNTPKTQVNFSEVGLRAAPTVTSKEFEIAIPRASIPDGINPLFPSSSVKILIRNRANFDWLPNLNSVFTYTFDETPTTPYQPIDINKSDNSYIRIVAYNTKLNSLLDTNKLDEYERLIKVIQPDIIGFVESADTTTEYIKSLFDSWIPLETSNGWYVKKHGGEVTVSRWKITQEWDLDRQFPVLINLPEKYGTDLLYTNAHLNCCGADDRRQRQVDEYAAFVLDAKSPGGQITLPKNTPIVYSGDLNLVGLSDQLATLLTGQIKNVSTYGSGAPLDWDDTDFKHDNALQTDIPMAYTWRSDGSNFPPGKLDFIIYSDYVLKAEKTFVIQTEEMPSERLNLFGLQEFDTSTASDHFPVIADFSINRNTLNTDENFAFINKIFPNPATNKINIQLNVFDTYNIRLYNAVGNLILTTEEETNSIELDINTISVGLYHLAITNSKGERKFIKVLKK